MTLVALAGCGDSGVQGGETVTVYVSMPLRGPAGPDGRDVIRGAKLALEEARGRVGQLEIRAVYMDETAGSDLRWDPVRVAQNARRATEDSIAIAYIGDFESGATRFSLPITNSAGMLQVSPASAATDLVSEFPGTTELPEEVQTTGERTFGRVIPDDLAQAAAAAEWARRLGARRAATFSGRSQFGDTMVEEFTAQSEQLGLSVQGSRPGAAPPLVYVATTADELASSRAALRAVRSAARVVATDAVLARGALTQLQPLGGELRVTSAAQDPSQLRSQAGRRFVRDFRRRYRREPGRYAGYGHEAMAVVIDSIRRAGELGEDRGAVIDAFFRARNRDSALGTYSIDSLGNTTLDRLGGYRLSGGQLRFDRPLPAP